MDHTPNSFEADWGCIIHNRQYQKNLNTMASGGAEPNGYLVENDSSIAQNTPGFSSSGSGNWKSGQYAHDTDGTITEDSSSYMSLRPRAEYKAKMPGYRDTNGFGFVPQVPQLSQQPDNNNTNNSNNASWDFLSNAQEYVDCHACVQGDDSASCDGSDCSAAGACPSQCGESGQGSICCNGPQCLPMELCQDASCEGAAQPCTDNACTDDTANPLRQGAEAAAAAVALQSFGEPIDGGAPRCAVPNNNDIYYPPRIGYDFGQQSQNAGFHPGSFASLQSNSYSYVNQLPFGQMPTTALQAHNLDPVDTLLRANPQFILGTHLYQHHDTTHHQHVADGGACPAENLHNVHGVCTLPVFDGSMSSLQKYGNESQCGFQADNLAMWQQHALHEHRDLFSSFGTAVPNLDCGDLNQFSWPEPAPTDFHATPEASAPDMTNDWSTGVDTPQVVEKPRDLQEMALPSQDFRNLPSPARSLVSNDLPSQDAETLGHDGASDSEDDDSKPRRCLWKDAASGKPCNKVFEGCEALDAHCKKEHVKPVAKDPKDPCVFECLWEGCTRDVGFPQKGKLTRHIQTHTGCKFHIFFHVGRTILI